MVNAVGVLDSQGIQRHRIFLQPWIVVLSASLFFFYVFIQLNMFNAVSPSLMREFSISAAQLGQLSSYYFWANVVFLFPAGMLLDRLPTRKTMLSALLVCVVSIFVFSTVRHLWMAAVCRFLIGAGGAFCFLSAMKLATRWFPPARMALVTGLIVTMAMLGGMVAQTPLTLLTDAVGWRSALFWTGCLGLLFLVIIAAFVRDYPPGYAAQAEQDRAHLESTGFRSVLWQVVRNSQTWLGGLYTSFMNLPIFLLGAIWGSLYLVQTHHMTRAHASLITSMLFVGTIIGSPVLGWFSDRISLRRWPMGVCAVLSLATILCIMYMPHLNFMALLLLFFALGFFTSAQVIGYPLVAESNPHALTGTSVGLASVLIMGGGLLQPAFGGLMGLRWKHVFVNHVPFYSVGDYRLAMMIIVVAFILGFFAVILARETHCKPQD